MKTERASKISVRARENYHLSLFPKTTQVLAATTLMGTVSISCCPFLYIFNWQGVNSKKLKNESYIEMGSGEGPGSLTSAWVRAIATRKKICLFQHDTPQSCVPRQLRQNILAQPGERKPS